MMLLLTEPTLFVTNLAKARARDKNEVSRSQKTKTSRWISFGKDKGKDSRDDELKRTSETDKNAK